MNTARLLTEVFMISLLASILTVLGCGVLPTGQASVRPFTVAGFTLPIAMVYSTKVDVPTRVPGIATSQEGARGFVQRLVMQTVFDVLESQGRSALLPDTAISAILSQLNVNITYEPLECEEVAITRKEEVSTKPPKPSRRCIIVGGNTVTGICIALMEDKMCDMPAPTDAMIAPVTNYTSISGTLSTTNIIMANWSRTMWQGLLNRAARMLTLGPFGSHFFSASATVGGN